MTITRLPPPDVSERRVAAINCRLGKASLREIRKYGGIVEAVIAVQDFAAWEDEKKELARILSDASTGFELRFDVNSSTVCVRAVSPKLTEAHALTTAGKFLRQVRDEFPSGANTKTSARVLRDLGSDESVAARRKRRDAAVSVVREKAKG